MASGRVSTPNTLLMLEADETIQADSSQGRVSSPDHVQNGQDSPYRPRSRQSVGSRAGSLDSGLARRTPTPSKQVFLTTVRRKDDLVDDRAERPDSRSSHSSKRSFYGDVQAMTSKLNQPLLSDQGRQLCKKGDNSVDSGIDKCDGDPGPVPTNKNNSSPSDADLPQLYHQPQASLKTGREHQASSETVDNDDSNDNESDDDDDDDDDDKQAPSQLLMEFLNCLMEKDYTNAEKLCKMILLYEPENSEALKFQPLIQEKLQQEEEGSSGGDDDDSGEDEDDSEDDSDSEESDTDGSSSEEDGEEDSDQSK